MLSDQSRLRQQLIQLRKSTDGDTGTSAVLAQIMDKITASSLRRQQRLAKLPTVTFSDELPVSQHQAEIAKAISDNQVLILAGETGSGKTTQLPKICLSIGRGVSGMIGHTQPRRIAARSVAARIAEELASPLGDVVGYKVRFSDHTHADSYIKLMTDGILLAELLSDRKLSQYDTLIIDEAHERSLNIDFLLGYLKIILSERKDLKLIITSATIDTERFSRHFENAPVIEVSGRTFPVEVRYQPLDADENGETVDLATGLLAAVDELAATDSQGDILVFLNGERDIRDVAEALRKHHPANTEILPLYSRLSASEQNRIFHPGTRRRIILATNVAETSLTVPGIRYVIDSGTARISRYSYRSKVQRLPIEKISRSSADQRAGRCGRVSEGICIRLFSEEDYQSRPFYTEPEIQRTNLASVILQMRLLGLGDPEDFPFIDPPDNRFINDGFRLLKELGAIDDHRKLSSLGRDLARIPVDPKIGRMVLAAKEFACLHEVLVIASALSIQDPRERPADKQQKAAEKHAQFQDEDSDFISLLNLWRDYQEKQKHLSQNQLRKHCRNNFLSFMRMKEWKETHQQLRAQVKNMGMKINQTEAGYTEIHRSLLTGLLGNIGTLDDSGDKDKARKKSGKNIPRYLGGRNKEFYIFPGSVLAKKSPRWIMAAELVETSRLFARTNARIDQEWIEPAATHLLKHAYTEPFWDERRGQVLAFESVSLYGLILAARRRVFYGTVNPEVSRELFIREALVKGRLRTKALFHQHNQSLINEAYALEDKARRRDIFAEEEQLFRFFENIIPENIHTSISFEHWRKKAEKNNPDILSLSREDVISQTSIISGADYPAEINIDNVIIPLGYCFDPGGEEDGVTATIPLGALNQLNEERFEWLVPGFLTEKVIAVLKGMPKTLRKRLLPIPDKAKLIVTKIRSVNEPSLMTSISKILESDYAIKISANDLREIDLPAHLRMRFCIIDHEQKKLSSGRDLIKLRQSCGTGSKVEIENIGGIPQWPESGIRCWDFGSLPESIEIERGGSRYRVFPALVDNIESVGVQLFDSLPISAGAHAGGVRRLTRFAVAKEIKYLRRNLPGVEGMCLQYSTLGSCEDLKEDIINAAIDECFFTQTHDVRNKDEFYSLMESHRGRLVEVSNSLCQCLSKILNLFRDIHKHDGYKNPLIPQDIRMDIQSQLDGLVYTGFLVSTPKVWLPHLPRFLNGILLRLQKLTDGVTSDSEKLKRLKPFLTKFGELITNKVVSRNELDKLRWMLEEYRVSIFAQTLKTSITVSPQRIEKQVQVCLGK